MVACTPKADYIRSKFEPLSCLLLNPVFFAGIGIKVERLSMGVLSQANLMIGGYSFL